MAVKTFPRILPLLLALVATPLGAQRAQVSSSPGGGVTIDIVDTDVRAAVQSLSRYLDRPVVFGQVNPVRVTLTSPRPVAPGDVLPLMRSMLEANGHEIVADGGVYRVQAKQAPAPVQAAPLQTTYGPQVGGPGGPVQLIVIRLRHARAADVAATVNALYGKGGALGELGERPSTLSQQLRDNRIPPPGSQQQGPNAAGNGSGGLTGDLVMVPDERTNSLLVRANPADFQLIQEAVRQVDVRPLQVLIEVVIAEVRRNSSFSLGLSSALDSVRIHGHEATVSGGNTGLGGLHGFVFRAMGIGGDVNVDLTLEAAASHGDATIVSRPVVLAANNESADILVGDQVPFVQLQRTLPTDNGVRDQIVQYKDVGTHLTVRPTISVDGDVALQVTQEINDVNAGTTVNGVDAPVISTRSLQTDLLVKDGQTAVLGGLARRRRDSTRGGVPFLSRLPILGWIFGGTTRDTDDTELFLFLTPRVIRDDAAMDSTTEGVRRAAPGVTKAAGKVPSVVTPPPSKQRPPASPQQTPAPAPPRPSGTEE